MSRFKIVQYYSAGKAYLNESRYLDGQQKDRNELAKRPLRTEIINFLLSSLNRETVYLEIGVRNPSDNYSLIQANKKYSVDAGLEYEDNPVDFVLTSDTFFQKLKAGKLLEPTIKFDVIFIDGLHLADQVERDIKNAFEHIHEDGYIVLHDCNPPTEWHARTDFAYLHTPAGGSWNGTTWKAFLKQRFDEKIYTCCIDSDYGVGIISKTHNIGNAIKSCNPFFEFDDLDAHRKEYLNLVSFDAFQKLF